MPCNADTVFAIRLLKIVTVLHLSKQSNVPIFQVFARVTKV